MRKFATVMFALIVLAGIAACLDSVPFPPEAKAQSGSYTQAQREWIDSLTPEKVAMYMRYDVYRERRAHWETVRTVEVLDMTMASRIVDREPIGRYDGPVEEDSKVWIWFALATPKNFHGPEEIQIAWYHGGELKNLSTYEISSRSPYYRLWDQRRVRWSGNWDLQVKYRGEVIHTYSFVVQ